MKHICNIGLRDFKRIIINSARIKEGWYFSQTKECYYADYKPQYPDKTPADFTVAVNHSTVPARITIYADTVTLPIIRNFTDLYDLEDALSMME